MDIEISILNIFVKPLLWFSKYFNDNNLVLVCKGYGDDWENFTGLYWNEDKYISIGDYNNYKLWINI